MAIQGTSAPETLFGTDAGELIAGKGGNDIIFGYLGNDRLWGGLGDDYLDGGAGYDELRGRQGNDTLIGGDGYAFLDGGLGDDLIVAGQNFSSLYGGKGTDTLVLCHGVADGGAGNDFIAVGEWDDFGWQAIGEGTQPIYSDEDLLGPTVIFGGEGSDAVDMAFRLGEDGMLVRWGDYTAGETLSLSIYAEDGTLIADDATTKDWLDTDNDGRLTDADGDGMGLDVSFDPTRGALSIRVENDTIELSSYLPGSAPVDFLLI